MSSSGKGPDSITLCCRECGEALAPSPTTADRPGEDWVCARGHRVPVVVGVVDCRPALKGFDAEADRQLALELAEREDTSFEELLRLYWKHRPEVTPELVERFVTGDLIGVQRASAVADQIEALIGGPLPGSWCALEIGGGTGALGAALAGRCAFVVITDISLAWLVLARRRLRDLGIDNVLVVAATGDALPALARSFDLIVAADVIEHVPSAVAVIDHCYSMLRPGGALWLSTPNRLSLTPEPHVRLWGVGLLPRRLGRAYVRRRRGVDYDDIETLSLFTLRRLVAATGGTWTVAAPEITAPVRATYRRPARLMIDGYHLARRVPLVRQAVLVVTPLFHALIRRPADG